MEVGAKHMVICYDHLLLLFGVVSFLYRMRDVATYVTLFALGQSATLLFGVLGGVHVNAYLVDVIIGLSFVYKGLDNVGAFSDGSDSSQHESGSDCHGFLAPLCAFARQAFAVDTLL